MKKIIYSIAICLISFSTLAQKEEAIASALESVPSLEVKSDLLQFKKDSKQGFSVYLNSTIDAAEKQWKKFLTDQYQAEVKKTKSGLTCEATTMADISKSALDVTALFYEDENGCKMHVFYQMNGYFLNEAEHPAESLAITKSLKDFQKRLYVEVYRTTLDDQRKALEKETKVQEKLTKEGAGIDKDLAGQESDINKAEQEIIESEKKITEMQAKIQELQGEIEASQATIEELKESKEKKEEEIKKQTEVVSKQSAKIGRIKASSDKVNG